MESCGAVVPLQQPAIQFPPGFPYNCNFPNRMDPDLLSAAISGNVKRLERCRERRLNILSQKTPAGDTALHIAARNGHQKFVEKLLELPGDVEDGVNQFLFMKMKNRESDTALHLAASKGNTTIVQTLLDKCPDLAHEINWVGETALFRAVFGGHAEIVGKLLAVTPLGHSMKRLHGMTPLHFAFANPNIGYLILKLEDKHFRNELAYVRKDCHGIDVIVGMW